jgi:pyruvate formate lyase activating enzyme
MKEARYWEKLDDGKVRCNLCPHRCVIKPGKLGICRNKKNADGALWAVHYGEVTALAMDPIEKKPLYHFYPGRSILSVGTQGCNLGCDFCQNYHLWDGRVHTDRAAPEDIVKAAKRQGSFAVAYTYNEPYISFEYVLDTARLAHDAGIKNVLVTNGFYNPEPFEELLPLVDAMNIDLKSIRNDFYKRLCKARVDPVKRTIERAARDCLVEVTNLIVTHENDSDDDLQDLVDWVASVSPDIPIHFSAYRPTHKLKNPSTPMERLLRAYDIAGEKLNYVYLGNVILDVGADSFCPHCKATLVFRSGYRTRVESLKGDKCGKCGNDVHFVNE